MTILPQVCRGGWLSPKAYLPYLEVRYSYRLPFSNYIIFIIFIIYIIAKKSVFEQWLTRPLPCGREVSLSHTLGLMYDCWCKQLTSVSPTWLVRSSVYSIPMVSHGRLLTNRLSLREYYHGGTPRRNASCPSSLTSRWQRLTRLA